MASLKEMRRSNACNGVGATILLKEKPVGFYTTVSGMDMVIYCICNYYNQGTDGKKRGNEKEPK